jgi:hypothetical protein
MPGPAATVQAVRVTTTPSSKNRAMVVIASLLIWL